MKSKAACVEEGENKKREKKKEKIRSEFHRGDSDCSMFQSLIPIVFKYPV